MFIDNQLPKLWAKAETFWFACWIHKITLKKCVWFEKTFKQLRRKYVHLQPKA